MTTQKPFSLLVIPDDEPPVLSGTAYETRSRALAENVEWHFDRPSNEDETIARLKDADSVINIRSSVQFSRKVLTACNKLKILSVWGTGVDHVDLSAAEELGITVSNTPGYGAPYVAEHALTLALAVSRQIVQSDKHIRQGGWTRGFISELYGKTLGVVGTGAIGQRMIQLGRGIGMNVVAWTLHPTAARAAEYGVEFLTLDDLMEQSDVVDEAALLETLEQQKIAGAGLDVFESEPLPAGHPFTRLENVVLSPHAGGMAYNGTMRGLEMSVENLEAFAAGNPIYVVAQGNRR